MKQKEEIVKIIQKMSGKYSAYVVFSDWVTMLALAIQNSCMLIHDELWRKREQQYLEIVNRYTGEEVQEFLKLNALLVKWIEAELSDWLGTIYMESGAGNKSTGQFFTPFHLSVLTSKLGLRKDISKENPLVINEPSAGGSGMIIASALELQSRGLNYQNCMKVVVQDLDWLCVYMSYVQLSLMGIDAEVVQGNTLAEPYTSDAYPKECIFKTPKRMGAVF